MVSSETSGLAGHGLEFSAKLNSEPSPYPEKRQISLKIVRTGIDAISIWV